MHYIRKNPLNKLRGSYKGSQPSPEIKGRNRKLKITRRDLCHICRAPSHSPEALYLFLVLFSESYANNCLTL